MGDGGSMHAERRARPGLEQGDRAASIETGSDSLNIKMGNQATKLDLGQSSTEAMQSITLKVGQSRGDNSWVLRAEHSHQQES